MTKWLAAMVVMGLALAAALVTPPLPPHAGSELAVNLPPVAICPVSQGSGESTTLGVISTISGPGVATVFSGGVSAGAQQFRTDASGTASIPLEDVAAVGTAVGLVELPNAESAAASTITGSDALAVESCQSTPSQQTLLGGGSSASGNDFEIQLMNPYAGEAMVSLVVWSESGLESSPRLEDIAVPTRSIVVVDLSDLLPGRENLAVTVNTTQGAVLSGGRMSAGADVALWDAVAPATDWFVPIPGEGSAQVVISTGVPADVDYQVDTYGSEGLVEAADSGQVPGRGQIVLDPSALGDGVSAVRVISSQPVAVFLRTDGADGLALASGAATPTSRWLLPGAGAIPGVPGTLYLLNTGLDDATGVVTSLRSQSLAKKLSLPAGQVYEFDGFPGVGEGYAVTADGDVVVLWAGSGDSTSAYTVGVPLFDE